eukprot:TRINITY_DN95463_c0_g1_i1.p1 TRINITY_DN95463_c0_g1~~TRINITY_DN95463_c0_g1_i1.p1  ORF type:complete len:144 (-),score=24.45 TRINITY_DN95463_c0_g1_i1:133-564(-)
MATSTTSSSEQKNGNVGQETLSVEQVRLQPPGQHSAGKPLASAETSPGKVHRQNSRSVSPIRLKKALQLPSLLRSKGAEGVIAKGEKTPGGGKVLFPSTPNSFYTGTSEKAEENPGRSWRNDVEARPDVGTEVMTWLGQMMFY